MNWVPTQNVKTSRVEAMGLEPTNLLTASQALYQLSYAPGRGITISGWLAVRCRWLIPMLHAEARCRQGWSGWRR